MGEEEDNHDDQYEDAGDVDDDDDDDDDDNEDDNDDDDDDGINNDDCGDVDDDNEDGVVLCFGCLTSQQHASVSQGRICSDNFTRCHRESDTDTWPTGPSTDPIMPGVWRDSHWRANL